MIEGHGQIQRAKIRQFQYYNYAQGSITSSLHSSLGERNRRSEPWDYVCMYQFIVELLVFVITRTFMVFIKKVRFSKSSILVYLFARLGFKITLLVS